jgi:pectate lyase
VGPISWASRRGRRRAARPLVATKLLALTLSAAGCGDGATARDFEHEVLAAEDGWASVAPGTTGGALATPDQTYVVHNRTELLAALNDGAIPPPPPGPGGRGEARPPPPAPPSAAPKIIVVEGTIDFNVDDANQPLSCEDYYRDGYTPQAFDAVYDPEVWGIRSDPNGPLEDARDTSRLEQQGRIRMRVGSNTTLVGRGADARLRGVWLDIRGSAEEAVSNIIIRNLTFEDTFDCFPEWWPTEGFLGSWNAQYDTISLRYVDHVWIDHNTFQDRETLDALQPERLRVKHQRHADVLQMRSASDLVTISYNRFMDHDSVMLIGSSDSAGDRGKLRVTLHHNLFRNTGQGTPRVRFGQVHLYNNLYDQVGNDGYEYSWGAGFESAVYAQNNFFATDASLTPDRFISRFEGTSLFEAGTMVDVGEPHAVDVVAAWNENNDPDLTRDVGWSPVLWTTIDATSRVFATVSRESGPFDW